MCLLYSIHLPPSRSGSAAPSLTPLTPGAAATSAGLLQVSWESSNARMWGASSGNPARRQNPQSAAGFQGCRSFWLCISPRGASCSPHLCHSDSGYIDLISLFLSLSLFHYFPLLALDLLQRVPTNLFLWGLCVSGSRRGGGWAQA